MEHVSDRYFVLNGPSFLDGINGDTWSSGGISANTDNVVNVDAANYQGIAVINVRC